MLLTAPAVVVALGVLSVAIGAAIAQSALHRRAAAEARLISIAGSVLREMCSGLDARQAVCDATRRITGCASVMLYEPGSAGGRLPSAPTATAGTPATRDVERVHFAHAVDVWMEECPRVVPDAPGGTLLLEPVIREGSAAGVLCLLFPRRHAKIPERRQAAVKLLAAEAGVAIERADLLSRVRASERADAATRLARDLHDSVSQDVALASGYAQLAMRALDDDSFDARELISETATQLDRAQDDLRSVMRSLRERQPRDGSSSLPELVDALGAEHERRGGASVRVAKDVADWTRVAPEASEALYFVIREALHNALKHAPGAGVRVALRADLGNITAIVKDDGPGFDPAVVADGHYGLIGIRERAEALGGSARISSRRGGGTKVVVTLPRDGLERLAA